MPADPAARADAVAVMLWMSSSVQASWRANSGGLAAQRAAGTADRLLQMEERDFDLPSLSIQGGDLPGRMGFVVQEGGQHPHPGGLRPAAPGRGGDGEGDQPGDGVREPFRVPVAGLAAAPGPHPV